MDIKQSALYKLDIELSLGDLPHQVCLSVVSPLLCIAYMLSIGREVATSRHYINI